MGTAGDGGDIHTCPAGVLHLCPISVLMPCHGDSLSAVLDAQGCFLWGSSVTSPEHNISQACQSSSSLAPVPTAVGLLPAALSSSEKLLCGVMKGRGEAEEEDAEGVLGKGCYSVPPSCSWVC